ncbi:hypothetical protein DICA4_C03246 [Diutina catenulata]
MSSNVMVATPHRKPTVESISPESLPEDPVLEARLSRIDSRIESLLDLMAKTSEYEHQMVDMVRQIRAHLAPGLVDPSPYAIHEIHANYYTSLVRSTDPSASPTGIPQIVFPLPTLYGTYSFHNHHKVLDPYTLPPPLANPLTIDWNELEVVGPLDTLEDVPSSNHPKPLIHWLYAVRSTASCYDQQGQGAGYLRMVASRVHDRVKKHYPSFVIPRGTTAARYIDNAIYACHNSELLFDDYDKQLRCHPLTSRSLNNRKQVTRLAGIVEALVDDVQFLSVDHLELLKRALLRYDGELPFEVTNCFIGSVVRNSPYPVEIVREEVKQTLVEFVARLLRHRDNRVAKQCVLVYK